MKYILVEILDEVNRIVQTYHELILPVNQCQLVKRFLGCVSRSLNELTLPVNSNHAVVKYFWLMYDG